MISDRYTDSTLAYQGSARNLGQGLVASLHAIACRGTEPTLTIYLRITPELSAKRLGHQKKDRLEAEGRVFHQRVFEAYEALAQESPGRILVVDGDRKQAVIAEEIWRIVMNRWKQRD